MLVQFTELSIFSITQPLQKELQNLEDASGDIMLLDDDQCIPYPPHCCMSHVIWQSTTVLAPYISLPELICVMLPNGWVVSHRHGSSLHHATKRLVLYLTERGERTNNLDPACCAFATPLPFYSLAIYHCLYVTTKYR